MGLSNWGFLGVLFPPLRSSCAASAAIVASAHSFNASGPLYMVTYVENGRNNQIIQKQYSV